MGLFSPKYPPGAEPPRKQKRSTPAAPSGITETQLSAYGKVTVHGDTASVETDNGHYYGRSVLRRNKDGSWPTPKKYGMN
jgi:hypothetical protein